MATLYVGTSEGYYATINEAISAGDAAGNDVLIAEPANNMIVDASITGNTGDFVVIDGKTYVIGTNAFNNLTDAVNNASTTQKTTITCAAGTYDDSINFLASEIGQKGDIDFVAAAGAKVIFSGTLSIGYRQQNVGNEVWNAAISFDGITFDHNSKGIDAGLVYW